MAGTIRAKIGCKGGARTRPAYSLASTTHQNEILHEVGDAPVGDDEEPGDGAGDTLLVAVVLALRRAAGGRRRRCPGRAGRTVKGGVLGLVLRLRRARSRDQLWGRRRKGRLLVACTQGQRGCRGRARWSPPVPSSRVYSCEGARLGELERRSNRVGRGEEASR